MLGRKEFECLAGVESEDFLLVGFGAVPAGQRTGGDGQDTKLPVQQQPAQVKGRRHGTGGGTGPRAQPHRVEQDGIGRLPAIFRHILFLSMF